MRGEIGKRVMNRVVETLIYRLKPGTGAAFDRIMRDVSVPLHRRAGMDVVAYANSLHDPDAYILIRAYDDPDHLRASQDAFYASADWRTGPRAAIIGMISTSLKVITEVPVAAVEALRQIVPVPSHLV